MTTCLLDSSVLIHVARGNRVIRDRLDGLLDAGTELVICEPVAMEVLAGVPPKAVAAAEMALDAFRSIPVDNNRDFRAAGYLFSTLAALGRRPRGPVDCLIATAAMAADAVVLHTDREFEAIAEVSDLRQEWLPVA